MKAWLKLQFYKFSVWMVKRELKKDSVMTVFTKINDLTNRERKALTNSLGMYLTVYKIPKFAHHPIITIDDRLAFLHFLLTRKL